MWATESLHISGSGLRMVAYVLWEAFSVSVEDSTVLALSFFSCVGLSIGLWDASSFDCSGSGFFLFDVSNLSYTFFWLLYLL